MNIIKNLIGFFRHYSIKDPVLKHFAIPENKKKALKFVIQKLEKPNPSDASTLYICFAIAEYIELNLGKRVVLNGRYDVSGNYDYFDWNFQLHKLIPELTHPYELLSPEQKEKNKYWSRMSAWNNLLHEKFTQIKPDDINVDNTNKLKKEYIQSCINKLS